MYDPRDHLKRLVETHAPSGYEAPVAELLREEWAELVDEFDADRLGSLIGVKRATNAAKGKRKIMLAAHMDEIGLMVREIEDGFIYVHRISGIDPRVMLAQPVLVHGARALPGVVATMPPHMLSAAERKQFQPIDALVVDVGLPAEEVEQIVSVGDLVTVEGPLIELRGRKVASKAMDDRACIAVITTCLQLLRNMRHSWDVYAAATVQEEVGLRGATTAANHIEPDCAIALDVGFAEQPGVSTGAGGTGRRTAAGHRRQFSSEDGRTPAESRRLSRHPLAGGNHAGAHGHRCLGDSGVAQRRADGAAEHPAAQYALAGGDAGSERHRANGSTAGPFHLRAG